MDQTMRLLATDYVEVRGIGQFDPHGDWKTVLVHQVTATRSHHQPFDLEAFLKDPNPKTFDPDKVITASEPFDVDDFIRTPSTKVEMWSKRNPGCPLASQDRAFARIPDLRVIRTS